MDEATLAFLKDVSIGLIALYALILALRGSTKSDHDNSIVITKLVDLVGAFKTQSEKSVTAFEALTTKISTQTDAILANGVAISNTTSAVNDINKSIKNEVVPQLTSLLGEHQAKIIEEFKPVVQLLSTIGVGVKAQNESLMMHRQKEIEIAEQQKILNEAMLKAEKSLEAIFLEILKSNQKPVAVATVEPVEEKDTDKKEGEA